MKEISPKDDWDLHIKIVVKYALHLAEVEKADKEVVELAALLHDIGRIKFGGKDHDITGIPEAEKILKELNYSEEVIEKVTHCIKTHRANVNRPAETKEAEIIRDADAISHFDAIGFLFKVALNKSKGNIEEAANWLN